MNIESVLSRRGFVIGTGLAATATLLAPRPLLAGGRRGGDDGIVGLMRAQAASAKITTQHVRGGVSVLMGAGGNIAVLPGPDGKVLVDAGLSTARPQLSKSLAGLGADPISFLINTHWHFDHTDGNDWMHSEGAAIVAQTNCRKRLAANTRVEGWHYTFEARSPGALPVVDFNSALTLHVNNTTLELEALAPAHTDSDILVAFKEPDVIHVGDVWWNGHYPFIDYSTGGSIDGTIRAVETALSRVTPTTVIIPGHGPVGDKSQLDEFHEMLATVRQRVAAMKKQGKPLAEIVALKPTLEYDATFGHFLMAPADFTGLVYAGV